MRCQHWGKFNEGHIDLSLLSLQLFLKTENYLEIKFKKRIKKNGRIKQKLIKMFSGKEGIDNRDRNETSKRTWFHRSNSA